MQDGSGASLDRLVEASAWRVRLTEQGAESSADFDRWLADPANAHAWGQVNEPWRLFGEAATAPEMMDARVTALRRARSRKRSWLGDARTKVAAGLVAGVAMLAVWGGLRWVELQPDVYRTDMGERRSIALEDGSILALDSDTEVRVRYTANARRFHLVSGQARFDVAKWPTQPFTVQARDHVVVATGTAFNVDMLGAQVLITLMEGSVTVVPDSRRAPSRRTSTRTDGDSDVRILSPGQQLLIAPSGSMTLETVTADWTTAWETGQIVFENERLDKAVARVSRYGSKPILTDGPAGELRVTGVFRTGDPAAFLEAVTSYLPVEAVGDAQGRVTLRRKISSD